MESVTSLPAILEHLAKHRQDVDDAICAINRISAFTFPPQLPSLPLRRMVVEQIEPPTATPSAPHLVPSPGKIAAIRPNQFEGMKIWEAARAFLEQAKGPQSASQIATCLINGGISSRARHLDSNLYTLLANKPEIFRKAGPGLWTLQKSSR